MLLLTNVSSAAPSSVGVVPNKTENLLGVVLFIIGKGQTQKSFLQSLLCVYVVVLNKWVNDYKNKRFKSDFEF